MQLVRAWPTWGSPGPYLSPRPIHSLLPFGLGFRGRRDPTHSWLLCPQKFDELLHLASRGQHANVDMLVQDIYGGAHQTLGLSGNLIASSFGKSATADQGTFCWLAVPTHPPTRAVFLPVALRSAVPPEFSQEDMAKSLLHMISNDIGQLACLYARLHHLDRVYFGGFFIRGHPVTMRTITYSINFFSKVRGAARPPLRHPGLCSPRRWRRPVSPKLAGPRDKGPKAGRQDAGCPLPGLPVPLASSRCPALGHLCGL